MRILLALLVFLNIGFAEAKSAPKSQPAKAAKMTKLGHKLYGKRKVQMVNLLNMAAFEKLPYKKKKQLLKAYNDYLVATDKKGVALYNIMDWLIPTAEAANFYRNAGFLVAGGGAYTNHNFNTTDLLQGFPSSCAGDSSKTPCYPGFGVNTSGQAFCVPNTSNQTNACIDLAAKANSATDTTTGLDNLIKILETTPKEDPKYQSLVRVLGDQVVKVNQECSSTTSHGATTPCGRLTKAVADLNARGITNDKLGVSVPQVPGAATTSTPSASVDGSCAAVSTKALERTTGKPLDARWSAATAMSMKFCGRDFNFENVYKRFGTCFANKNVPSPQPPAGLKAAIEGNQAFNGALSVEFTKYFGLSPEEYKSVFCDSASSTQSFAAKMGQLANSGRNTRKDGCNTSTASPMNATSQALKTIRDSGTGGPARDLNRALMSIYQKVNSGSLQYKENGTPANAGGTLNALQNMAKFVNNDQSITAETLNTSVTMNQRLWILQQVSAENQALGKKVWDFIGAEEKNIAANSNFTGLSGSDAIACDNSFKAMMACVNSNVVESPGTGDRYSQNEVVTSFSDQCAINVEKPSILADEGSALYRSGPVVITTPPPQKCFVYDSLGPAISPVENRRVNASNALYPDQKLSMTISELMAQGYAVQQYSCGAGFKTEEVDIGFGRGTAQ